MLHEFLEENQTHILKMTEEKSQRIAGNRPSSVQLRKGLPIFYEQLLGILKNQKSGQEIKEESNLVSTAGKHGAELMRLGYTLSHVVHSYGSMCQAITELATKEKYPISSAEFHDLNRCLDVAISGAVTEFQSLQNVKETDREIQHLGFLTHELRNTLMTINISLQIIKKGTVGFGGSTGKVLEGALERMQKLIDQSLTEVRLKVDPKIHANQLNVLQFIDQILITADVAAHSKGQQIETHIDSELFLNADAQLLHAALSNLIQNAIKYTHNNGTIKVKAFIKEACVLIEIEDECGGLKNETVNLFNAFEQQNENREGLGLGLTIAEKSIHLNHGSIEVENLPHKGCIFRVSLPHKKEESINH